MLAGGENLTIRAAVARANLAPSKLGARADHKRYEKTTIVSHAAPHRIPVARSWHRSGGNARRGPGGMKRTGGGGLEGS